MIKTHCACCIKSDLCISTTRPEALTFYNNFEIQKSSTSQEIDYSDPNNYSPDILTVYYNNLKDPNIIMKYFYLFKNLEVETLLNKPLPSHLLEQICNKLTDKQLNAHFDKIISQPNTSSEMVCRLYQINKINCEDKYIGYYKLFCHNNAPSHLIEKWLNLNGPNSDIVFKLLSNETLSSSYVEQLYQRAKNAGKIFYLQQCLVHPNFTLLNEIELTDEEISHYYPESLYKILGLNLYQIFSTTKDIAPKIQLAEALLYSNPKYNVLNEITDYFLTIDPFSLSSLFKRNLTHLDNKICYKILEATKTVEIPAYVIEKCLARLQEK